MIQFNKKLTALQQALISKGHPPKVADIKNPTITNTAEITEGRFMNAADAISEGERILKMMRENRANAQPTAIHRAATTAASSKIPSLDAIASRIKSLTASAKALTAGRAPKAAAADLLTEYSAMNAGPDKIAFLAKHSFELQAIAKAQSRQD